MSEKRRADMKEHLELSWMGAIENANIRGKFKRAIRVFCDKDVRDVLESLDEAHNMVWLKWTLFAPDWAAAEVDRIYGELSELDDFMRKAAWEKARDDARRNSKNRLQELQAQIKTHVANVGGVIDYAPAGVAFILKKSRQSLKPSRVGKAMHAMVLAGMAKTVRAGAGKPDRFVLLQ